MKEMRKPAPLSDDENSRGNSTGKPLGVAPRTGRMRPADRTQAPFRSRLFAMLLLFAVVPTITVTVLWTGTASRALSMLSAGSAWERIARSGESAISAMRSAPLSAVQRGAVDAHETELRESVGLAKRFEFVASRTVRLIAIGALLVVGVIAVGASRVAGHLSRQLSRPLDELVGWTRLIRSGHPLPDRTERLGAPEFEVLRTSMRTMATELETARQRALEAERAEAFRESARRFAHELKNPLTPIRFAIERLRRSAPEELRDTVDVLAEESARLDAMARSFAQFGRLPDGPSAEIDIAELVTKTARSAVPDRLTLTLDVESPLPFVNGFYEPLVRAVTNVLINAVEATTADGVVAVRVFREQTAETDVVCISVRDSGCGIGPQVLAHVFDPYVTTKPGGTGLGLAIARQTLAAHRGEIRVTSTPGVGTEMALRLPFSGVENSV